MLLNPGTIVSNRYEIIDRLGSGGMAIVYRANDTKLGRFVTFKVMREEYIEDQEFISRFKIEARAAASLSHPNIVNVYDVGQENDIFYIVMEYIDGVTLKELIQKRAPFTTEEILGVAIQIAGALHHAHSNNVIHRDIKPDNILVTHKGVVKVADFGIARAASTSTITVDTSMGSVHYFSPEQARGGYVDYKSDIYSLGIVMFEMVTGTVPFDSDSSVAIALMHISDAFPNIKEINPDASDFVIAIIRKCTQKLSINRYDNIEAMAIDIKKAMKDESGEFIQANEPINNNATIKLSSEDLLKIRTDVKSLKVEENENIEEIEEVENSLVNKTERKIILLAVLTALAIISLISAVGINIYNKSKPVPVVIESLVGLSLTQATNITQKNLLTLIEKEIYDDTVPKGFIISEDWYGVEELVQGNSIEVVVSLGTDKISMKDFSGMKLADAYNIIKDLKFQPSEPVYDFYDEPYGTIVKQSPEAGSMVKEDSKIIFYASLGPKEKKESVPNLKGMSESDAIAEIKSVGLTLSGIDRSTSDTVAKGRVINQTLEAGRIITETNNTIRIVVSEGKITELPKATTEPPKTTKGTETTTLSKGKLPIDFLLPAGVSTIHLTVYEATQSGLKVIFEEDVLATAFPFEIDVMGQGEVVYYIYSGEDNNKKLEVDAKVDF